MFCGYKQYAGALDFHHIDPQLKSFGISSGGFSRSWDSIISEIRKCVLVCANCHREIELGVVPPEKVILIHQKFWNVD